MEITQQVRDYAAARGLTTVEALEAGMAERAEEFARHGAEIYVPVESVTKP
jgi:phosphomethylpyrimidine synthase